MPKGIVVTEEGKKLNIAPRQSAGLVACDGEAHTNPHIDNCSLCAPRWGQKQAYHPPTVEQVLEGFAVATSSTAEVREAFEKARKEGKIKMVHAVERYSGCTASYNVWVRV